MQIRNVHTRVRATGPTLTVLREILPGAWHQYWNGSWPNHWFLRTGNWKIELIRSVQDFEFHATCTIAGKVAMSLHIYNRDWRDALRIGIRAICATTGQEVPDGKDDIS